MPTLAEKVLAALGAATPIPPWPQRPGDALLADDTAGSPIEVVAPLVKKLTAGDIARLSRRFGGEDSGSSAC